jgi:hypothetical protein
MKTHGSKKMANIPLVRDGLYLAAPQLRGWAPSFVSKGP